MSANPTLRVHASCEPAMTPTVMLPRLSLANSAETSESATSMPVTARGGNAWQIARSASNAPHARAIENALKAAVSLTRRTCRPRCRV